MTRKSKFAMFLSLVLAFCLIGCTRKEENSSNKPLVYTSFYPVYDLVSQIGGDTIEVRNFMPLDKDPHLWEPSPKDIQTLSKADLLVVNGANMESWVDQVKESLPDLKVVTLSESVELISYKGAAVMGDFQYMAQQRAKKGETYKIDLGHTHEDVMRVCFVKVKQGESKEDLIKRAKEAMDHKGKLVRQGSTINVKEEEVYALEMGHERGEIFYKFPKEGDWAFVSDRISEPLLPYSLQYKDKKEELDLDLILEGGSSSLDKVTYDPHSWLSLTNAKKYLNTILNALSDLCPEKARLYQRNKVKIVDGLTDLELEYKEKFAALNRKEFIVTHYAYEYLAREFDLRQFPLQGLTSTESPSLKTIRKAIDFSNAKKINTIFYEYGNDPKEALALAEEIKGQAVGLTSMEYKTDQMKGQGSYQEIMRENLEKLYQSLNKEVESE